MRLTRRIALPTGLEICLGARPLPRDRAEAAPGEPENDAVENKADLPPAEAPPSRTG